MEVVAASSSMHHHYNNTPSAHQKDDSGDSVDSLSYDSQQSGPGVSNDGALSDPIILQLLANRPKMTDVSDADDEERKRRMYNMLRHSHHYKRLQVRDANTKWCEDLASLDPTIIGSTTTTTVNTSTQFSTLPVVPPAAYPSYHHTSASHYGSIESSNDITQITSQSPQSSTTTTIKRGRRVSFCSHPPEVIDIQISPLLLSQNPSLDEALLSGRDSQVSITSNTTASSNSDISTVDRSLKHSRSSLNNLEEEPEQEIKKHFLDEPMTGSPPHSTLSSDTVITQASSSNPSKNSHKSLIYSSLSSSPVTLEANDTRRNFFSGFLAKLKKSADGN